MISLMAEYKIPRCQIVPESDFATSFTIDGREVLRWNFGHHLPRPFFHPVIGPAGANLVRMGHPGAPNHDHHVGIWFAHSMIEEFNFWANGTGTQIRQRQWLDYVDGDDFAAMAVLLDFYDGHEEQPIVNQETIVSVKPLLGGESLIEFHLRINSMREQVTLNKTNFGIVAVRVAATIAEHFGDGVITNDQGVQHEPDIFGKASCFMDYSGPVRGSDGGTVFNGITLFDHPSNPNYPAKWHVREDGWMGPSLNRDHALVLNENEPLALRYQLHLHDGRLDLERAVGLGRSFDESHGWSVNKSTARHRSWEIKQIKSPVRTLGDE